MTPRIYLVAAGLVAAGMVLAGCAPPDTASAASTSNSDLRAGQLVPGNGTGANRVVLTMGTAERLGIQTTIVREVVTALAGESAPTPHRAIPMAAVFYDKTGATWTYTNPDPLGYVRQPVIVARIDSDLAILQSGPPPGTAVVTVGTAELAGIEDGVAGE